MDITFLRGGVGWGGVGVKSFRSEGSKQWGGILFSHQTPVEW